MKVRRRKRHHGHHNTPEWRAWYSMIKACELKAGRSYKYYGGLGIKVCKRWRKSFLPFLRDMGRRPSPDHSLGRLETDKDFYPENCKWLTRDQRKVRHGASSFGHVVRPDMLGRCFGKLTVVGYAETRREGARTHRAIWRCRCDCGNEKDVRGSYLRSRAALGKAVSCGKCVEHWTKRRTIETTHNPNIRIIRHEQPQT